MVVTGSLQTSYRGAVRIYGFEGEAGREGEGATRTTESSYRRWTFYSTASAVYPSTSMILTAGLGAQKPYQSRHLHQTRLAPRIQTTSV